MQTQATETASGRFRRMIAGWDRFWFTPADPTVLGLIRICTGLIVLYTLFVYTLDLQEMVGSKAWLDLETRDEWRHDMPQPPVLLDWFFPAQLPASEDQKRYVDEYNKKWGDLPPVPYPKSPAQALEFDEYRAKWGFDPRLARERGRPAWSIWFHVTDPDSMMAVQLGIVAVALLFTLGLGTRLAAPLTWLAWLSFMHRNPLMLFGADFMAAILLMYLSIAPSGAALSVDRLIARWWAKARVDVIGRWRAFWAGRAGVPPAPVSPGQWSVLPTPSVAANVAMRLLQIHLCFIYMSAGLAKLQGQAWWTGDAVWGTISNFEFAPMQSSLYVGFLKMLATNRLVFALALTVAAMTTLAFEISYPYLIWKRSTRPLLLTVAVLLHGSIGIFMGLKTFSLLMLAMNLVFVSPATVRWALRKVSRGRFGQEGMEPLPTPAPTLPEPEQSTAIKPEKPVKRLAGTVVKRKG